MMKTIRTPRGRLPAPAGRRAFARRPGGWAALGLLLALWVSSCSPEERGQFLTPEYTNDLVNLYAKSKLPKEAKEVYGHRMVGQSLTIHVRFCCTQEQLQSFLEASPVIPNVLQEDFRPFERPKKHIPFWRPHQLTEIRGLQTRWHRDGDEVGFLLMTGKEAKRQLLVVYMLFVIEHLASR